MVSGACQLFINRKGMKLKIINFLILFATLVISGCFSNKDVKIFDASVVTPPASIPYPEGATNFGTMHINEATVTERTITLTFTGGQPASSITGSVSGYYDFKGGAYPGTGGTCTTIEETGTCTIVITYWPLAVGTHNESVTLSFYNGFENTSESFVLSGTTVSNLTITPNTTNDQGSVLVGLENALTFTVENVGTVNMTGIAGTGLAAGEHDYENGAGYPGATGTCDGDLTPGETCTIVSDFNPTTNVTLNDTIILDYTNGINAEQITQAITGLGRNRSLLTISNGATFDYGNHVLTTSTTQNLTVSNTGDVSTTSLAVTALGAPFTFLGGTYPGTSGTCGDPITVGNCTIRVVYSPTATVTSNDTIILTYHDGVNAGQSASRPIHGTGITPANLAITANTSNDYGSRVIGTQTDYTFTVTNSGQATGASVSESTLAAPFTFATGSFPGGGTCTTSIVGGTNCTIIVRYSPSAAALQTGTITLGYSDEASAKSTNFAIQGTGLNPASLSITDVTSNDFGSVKIEDTPVDRTFNVSNNGDVNTVTIVSSGLDGTIYKFKGGTFPGTGGTCTATIVPGANVCTMVITYTPTVSGVQADTVILTYNNGLVGGQTTNRALTGTAQDAATLSITDDTTNDYGNNIIGNSSDLTFNVSNSGNVNAVTVVSSGLDGTIYKFKGGAFPGTGGTCTATIVPGASVCTMVITYTPTVSGVQADTVILTYNNGLVGGQTATRALTGTAQDAATLSITDDTTNDFGSVSVGGAGTSDRTFNVSNSGDVNAIVVTGGGLDGVIYQFKGGAFPGTGGTCTATIVPGANVCTIVVTYDPTGLGVNNDTIELTYNNGLVGGQTATRAITGTGVAFLALTFDEIDYNFGLQLAGSTNDKILSITNQSQFKVTNIKSIKLNGPYYFKDKKYPGTGGSCQNELKSYESCTLVITYRPVKIGIFNKDITLMFDYQNDISQISTKITGTSEVDPSSPLLFNLLSPHKVKIKDDEELSIFTNKLPKINEKQIKYKLLSDFTKFYKDESKHFIKQSLTPLQWPNQLLEKIFIVSAPTSSKDGTKKGQLYILDFVNNSILYTVQGQEDYSYFGLSHHNIGDMDNDGIDDFITGVYENDGNYLIIKHINIFSGMNGNLLHEL